MHILEPSRLHAEADLSHSTTFTHYIVMVDGDFQRAVKQLSFRDAEQQSFVENCEGMSDFLQSRFPFAKFVVIMEKCSFRV